MKLFKPNKPNIRRAEKKKLVDALIKVLKDSGWDMSIRLAAVSALGEMSDLQAIEALIEALEDSDSGIRQAVAATLGQLGYMNAMGSLEALVAALQDKKSEVRKQAAYIGVPTFFPPIFPAKESARSGRGLKDVACPRA